MQYTFFTPTPVFTDSYDLWKDFAPNSSVGNEATMPHLNGGETVATVYAICS